MTWIPLGATLGDKIVIPMSGETVQVKLATGKVLDLIYDEGDWLDPRYLPMRVIFQNVTHWTPMGGY